MDEEQLPQEPPPPPPPPDGIWSSMPMSEPARETNLDMARPERDLHFGQPVSSPDLDRGSSFSNLMWHFGQMYS